MDFDIVRVRRSEGEPHVTLLEVAAPGVTASAITWMELGDEGTWGEPVFSVATRSFAAASESGALHALIASRLVVGTFAYGSVPEGFVETYPRAGPPAPLQAERRYAISFLPAGSGAVFTA